MTISLVQMLSLIAKVEPSSGERGVPVSYLWEAASACSVTFCSGGTRTKALRKPFLWLMFRRQLIASCMTGLAAIVVAG